MKYKYQIFLGISVLILCFCSCASSSKLESKGWKLYYSGKLNKAEKKFNRAIDKNRLQAGAYQGISKISRLKGNFYKAEKYMETAYRYNSNSSNTYEYARLVCKNGDLDRAMNLLYELPVKGDFGFYRSLATKEQDFNKLRSSLKFKRYLLGYRRLKITPYHAYSTDLDGIFNENDLYVVVENQGKVLLATNVVQESNYAYWNDQYIIFDYPLGTSLSVSLMEEDIVEHDNLIMAKGHLVPGDFFLKRGNSGMKFKVEDTELSPMTTGTHLPSELSAKELIVGLGITALGYAVISDLNKTSSISTEKSPFISCSIPVRNSTDLYVLAVGTDSDILADADAMAITNKFRELCGNKKLFGNIYTITLSGGKATKNNIMSALQEIKRKTNEDDIFLFFFSGHGAVVEGVYTFATAKHSTEPVFVDEIIKTLNSDNCKAIMWFDTCHAGRVKNDFRDNVDDYIKGKYCPNVSILMSSSDGETSFADHRNGLGFFTKAIIDGLNGAADKNGNRIVSLDELEEYVVKTVPIRTRQAGFYNPRIKIQHPQQLKDGKEEFKTRLSVY